MNKDKSQQQNTKNCPQCNELMFYKNKQNLNYSIKHGVICKKCKKSNKNLNRERSCPKCSKIIKYTNKYNCLNAKKAKKLCKSCGIKKSCKNPERRKAMSERVMGDKNPMFGKTGRDSPSYGRRHTEETKLRMSEERRGIPLSKKHRNKLINYAKNHDNPMKGKSVYSVWLEKYGKKEADRLMDKCRGKHSKNNSGEGNPMYGKSPSKKAGRGWTGKYKGKHFFRSLKELSYMIFLDEQDINWISAEKKMFMIEYLDKNNIKKTYKPDFFLVDENLLIEIKPKRLQNSPSIQLKTKAARKFCKNKGLEFKIMDVEINAIKIKEYLDKGDIKFNRDYEQRFLEYINK